MLLLIKLFFQILSLTLALSLDLPEVKALVSCPDLIEAHKPGS